MFPFLDKIQQKLAIAENEARFRTFRAIEPAPQGRCIFQGKSCFDFSSNDYLGLADHPHLIEKSIEWTTRYGAGGRGSRLVTGTYQAILDLEERLAQWKQTESALIIGAGYMANVGLLHALAEKGAVFFGDKLNHASLNLGCASDKITFKRYKHNDLAHLESLLSQFADIPLKVIVSDTVFSMDGDVADTQSLRALAQKFNALLYLDDAHAGGLIGPHGKGLAGSDFAGEIAMGTCSKAFGSYGSYVGCTQTLKDYFVNYCSSTIYTTALPPSVYGTIEGALDLFMSEEGAMRRENVMLRANQLREGLHALGLNTLESSTPIVPVIVGENETVMQWSNALLELGFLGVGIRSPTVPLHTARLRLSVSAAHTQDDISQLLNAIQHVQKKFKP